MIDEKKLIKETQKYFVNNSIHKNDLAEVIANLPKVGEWVAVSERLPEEKGEYLVTYHPCWWDRVSEEICVGVDSFRGKTSWAKHKFQKVVAWMPKPEPYKESED